MALYSKEWWYPSGDPAIAVRAVVFTEDGGTLANIYADAGFTTPLANPTTTNGAGVLTFYVPDGRYWIYVGDDFSGDSELVTVSATVTGTVSSVNFIGPDEFGNVELDASDVGALALDDVIQKGDILVGTGAGTVARLPVGAPDQALFADPSFPTGLQWATIVEAVDSVNGYVGNVVLTSLDVEAQPIAVIQDKGDLYVGTSFQSTTNLSVGPDGTVLTADSGALEGVSWQVSPSAPVTSVNGEVGDVVLDASDVGAQSIDTIDAKGDLYVGTGPNATDRLGVGANGRILSTNSATPTGLEWIVPPSAPVTSVNTQTGAVVLDSDDVGAIAKATLSAKGSLISATAPGVPADVPAGLDGQFLRSNSTVPEGVDWATPSGAGDVDGPASSTDTALVRFDGLTGKIIQDSVVTLTDGGTLNIPEQVGPFPGFSGDLLFDQDTQALIFANDQIATGLDRQTLLLVHNNSGDILSIGMPVYITGDTGTYPYPLTVDRAQADDFTTARAVGLCAHSIPDGTDGYVVLDGIISGYPTSSYSPGDYLYVSPTIPGSLTNVRPADPDYAVCVGQVGAVDVVHGSISVFRAEAAVDAVAPVLSVNGQTGVVVLTASSVGAPPTTRAINAGTGLTGGGDLSADRTISANFGTSGGTITEGNDVRVTGAAQKANNLSDLVSPSTALANLNGVPQSRTIFALNGLQGSSDLSTNVTLEPVYGTGANQVMQGNDTRVVNAIQSTLVDAKGDLLAGSAADTVVRVPVGADNTVLTADSTQTGGVRWATNAGGDVTGPASSTAFGISRFDGTTGKLIKNSATTLSDAGTLTMQTQSGLLPAAASGSIQYSGRRFLLTHDEPEIVLPVGFQSWMEVRNNTGSTITVGSVVYINGNAGGLGGLPTVALARADAAATATAVGIASHDIETASNGYITTHGQFGVINTSSYSNGDVLYLSPSSAGGLTNVRPAAPNIVTPFAVVMHADALGSIQVFSTPVGTTFDTKVAGPASSTDNALARFDSTTGKLIQNSGVTLSDTGTFIIPSQSAPAAVDGQLYYNGDTLVFNNSVGLEVSLRIGRQTFAVGFNTTGSTISTGAVVYVTTSTTGTTNIGLARADALATAQAFGIAAHPIENNTAGLVVINGSVTGVNTSAFAQGDVLYLSSSSAGALTATKPSAPNFVVKIGTNTHDNVSGTIDVNIDAPILGNGSNGQVLVPDSTVAAGQSWVVNSPVAIHPKGFGYSPAGGVAVARSNHISTLNLMHLLPFQLLASETLTSIAFEVTGATASAVCRFGVYGSNSSSEPTGSPLADFGTTAADTTGIKTLAVSLALKPADVYYLAIVGQVAAPNLRFFTGFNPWVASGFFPSGTGPGWNVAYTQTGVSGALPAIGALSVADAPVVGLLF